MSGLAHTFRFQAQNTTGVTVNVTVEGRLEKYGADGALVFSDEITPINGVNVSTGAVQNSATINNATDKWTIAKLTLRATPASSPAAGTTLALYLQESQDGGSTWPEDGGGIFIGAISFAASTTPRSRNLRIR